MDTPKKTIQLYLFLSALFNLGVAFIGATYVLFLLGKGLNLFEANLVNVAFYATLVLFEIPTGAIADVYGRKLSFVIACSLFSLGLFLYAISNSFWGFALSESVSAIGATFASGAFQAWLKDQLAHQGQQNIRTVLSAENVLDQTANALGAIIGVWLYSHFSPSTPWLVGGITTAICGMLASVWMREDYFTREKHPELAPLAAVHADIRNGIAKMRTGVSDSIRYGFRSESVRFLLVLGTAQSLVVTAPNMQWQPLFRELFGGIEKLGLMRVGMTVFLSIGAALAPWFVRRVKNERKSLLICQMAIGVGIAGTVIFGNVLFALGTFLLHEIGRGAFKPIKDTYLNDQIPSEVRATLLSFENMSHHIGGGIGLVVSGWLALHFGIKTTWIVFGLLLTLSAAVNFHRERKNGKK